MSVVLVVEDEPQVLILAESLLEDAGYEAVSASTIAEGLAILQSDQRIDLLFTDIELGDQKEGGLTLAEKATKAHPGLPVLYATAREITDGMKALFVEPHGFLPKPYTAEKLVEAVRNILRRAGDAG